MLQSLELSKENEVGVLDVFQARTMNGCLTRHKNLVTNGNGNETSKMEMGNIMGNSWLDCIQ
jgi:hypothetical protein